MKRPPWLIAGVLLASQLTSTAQVARFWDFSRLEDRIGDAPAILYLGPSPQFYSGILEFIYTASNTLDVCMFSMDLPAVSKGLLEAHARGVRVRLTMPPGDHSSRGGFSQMMKRLEGLGLLTYSDNRSGLMHNKFMVADGKRIWTSSANFTRTCRLLNDNHALMIEHPLLAANFTAEMEEILAGLHGRTRGNTTPYPVIDMGRGVTLYCYFLPEDEVKAPMIKAIESATNTIDILAFSLTNEELSSALHRRLLAGVTVRIMLENSLARHPASRLAWFSERNVDVRISPNDAQMHHKTMIIDDDTLIIGSANFSDAAFYRNDENVLIFRHPRFAGAMRREFDRCWRARSYMFNKWNNPVD